MHLESSDHRAPTLRKSKCQVLRGVDRKSWLVLTQGQREACEDEESSRLSKARHRGRPFQTAPQSSTNFVFDCLSYITYGSRLSFVYVDFVFWIRIVAEPFLCP